MYKIYLLLIFFLFLPFSVNARTVEPVGEKSKLKGSLVLIDGQKVAEKDIALLRNVLIVKVNSSKFFEKSIIIYPKNYDFINRDYKDQGVVKELKFLDDDGGSPDQYIGYLLKDLNEEKGESHKNVVFYNKTYVVRASDGSFKSEFLVRPGHDLYILDLDAEAGEESEKAIDVSLLKFNPDKYRAFYLSEKEQIKFSAAGKVQLKERGGSIIIFPGNSSLGTVMNVIPDIGKAEYTIPSDASYTYLKDEAVQFLLDVDGKHFKDVTYYKFTLFLEKSNTGLVWMNKKNISHTEVYGERRNFIKGSVMPGKYLLRFETSENIIEKEVTISKNGQNIKL